MTTDLLPQAQIPGMQIIIFKCYTELGCKGWEWGKL